MVVAAHNIAAMNADRIYKINTDKKKKSTEKLASGYRINRSADDAAGLSISEKMRKQIRGLDQGSENAQDGVSLCQVADGALAETLEMMHRITELSIQSANETNSMSDRSDMQKEVQQLLSEIDRIADTTTFNGQRVFAEEKGFDLKNSAMAADMGRQTQAANATGGSSGPVAVTTGASQGVDSPVRSVSWSGSPGLSGYYADTYTFDADDVNGITIIGSEDVSGTPYIHNTVTFPWNTITNQNGDTLDTLADGNYSISENGITYSFQISGARSLSDVAAAVDDMVALATTQTRSVVTPAVTNHLMVIDDESAVLAATGLGVGTHQITADANGITIGSQTVQWSNTNLSSAAAGGGTVSVDFGNGLNLSFDVADGTSENEAAAAFDGASFSVTRDMSSMTFTASGTSLTYSTGPSTYNASNFEWSMLNSPSTDDGLRATGLFAGDAPIPPSTVGTMTVTFAGGSYQTGANTTATLYMGVGTTSVTYNITADSLARIRGARSASSLEAGSQIPVSFVHGNSVFTMNFAVDSAITGDQFLQSKGERYAYSISGIHEGLKIGGFSINGIDAGNSIVTEQTTFTMKLTGAKIWQAASAGSTTYIYPGSANNTGGADGKVEHVKKHYAQYMGERQLWIQSGAGTLEGMVLKIGAVGTRSLGLRGLDISSEEGALDSLDRTEGAIVRVNSIRAKIGAQQNRLESAVKIDDNSVENLQASESKIRDTDMAGEMVRYSKSNILGEVGESMMAQANQKMQGVVGLLGQ